MKSLRIAAAALLAAMVLTAPGPAAAQRGGETSPAAQTPRADPQPDRPDGPGARPEMPEPPDQFPDDGFSTYGRPSVRIGQDFTVRATDRVREVVVVSGSVTIEGRVSRDVVVVLGSATLGPNAYVGGNLVVVSGDITVAPGAVVNRDLVVVAGELRAPPDFAPGGEHVVVGSRLLGYDFRGLVPWITQGLLWGRPLVPSLPWIWWFIAGFFFVYLIVSLIAPGAIKANTTLLSRRPVSAFLTGLLVLLLVGPVSVILSVSVIGIPVVPLLFCALLVAGVLGKVGVMHWIGDRIVAPDPDVRWHQTRSFLIGFAVITVAYMIPVLGFTTWALLGVLGLGAASLAFLTALRRENPESPRRPVPPVPPIPPPPAPMPAAGSASFYAGAPAFVAEPGVGPDAGSPPPGVSYAPPPAPPISPAAVPAIGADLRGYPRAPFLDRAAAFALDVIFVLIGYSLLDLRGPDEARMYFLFLLLYHIGFWVWKGTTVGGIICNLRVIRTDGTPLQFVDALVRGVTAILSLVVVGLGALWILKDPERQAWHDKIAGTFVVKVPRTQLLG